MKNVSLFEGLECGYCHSPYHNTDRCQTPKANEQKHREYNDNDLAYVYIATQGGQAGKSNVRILYVMKIGDAKKLCSSEKTKGKNYGSEWALFWTAKDRYDSMFNAKDLKFQVDDGRFETLFKELGIKNLQTNDYLL